MLSLFIGIYEEDLSNAVVVIPLLQEFFFVRRGITLDEILQLREVGREQHTTTHGRWSQGSRQKQVASVCESQLSSP